MKDIKLLTIWSRAHTMLKWNTPKGWQKRSLGSGILFFFIFPVSSLFSTTGTLYFCNLKTRNVIFWKSHLQICLWLEGMDNGNASPLTAGICLVPTSPPLPLPPRMAGRQVQRATHPPGGCSTLADQADCVSPCNPLQPNPACVAYQQQKLYFS